MIEQKNNETRENESVYNGIGLLSFSIIVMIYMEVMLMRNTVNKFMVLCCLVIAFFYLMIPAPASAMGNWVWVYSNAKYGFNLNTDYITTHKNENGKVDSADIWMRINYTYEGAKADLEHFDVSSVNASDLQNGCTIYRLHIEFISGKITPMSIVMYDKNDVALYRVENLESTTDSVKLIV